MTPEIVGKTTLVSSKGTCISLLDTDYKYNLLINRIMKKYKMQLHDNLFKILSVKSSLHWALIPL